MKTGWWIARIRRRTGSLAVFFCIMLAGLVLVLNSWLQAARIRSAEASLSQAMAAQINVTLASFEQSLFEQFGFLAFSESSIDRQVFYNSLPPALQACPLWLGGKGSLTDPAVLDKQMVRQMKTRLPGAWLDLFITRWSDLNERFAALRPVAGDALGLAAPGTDDHWRYVLQHPAERSGSWPADNVLLSAEPLRAGSLTDLLRSAFRGLSAALVRRTAEYLFDQLLAELLDEMEADLLGEMRGQFSRFAAAGGSAGDHLIVDLPDFFDPHSLTRMAVTLEGLLDFSTYPIYEKLCVVEYIMSYMTARPPGQFVDGQWHPARTPDGRLLQDLQAERPAEIEQIASGIMTHELAAGTCRLVLVSIRSLLHVAGILTDESRMALLRGTAATIVAAVAAVSLGTVVVEPEAVTYLLVAAEALAAGIRESGRLIDGHGVRFWPGRGSVDFILWYDDYLRLMLYSLPRATLVDRTGQILGRQFSEALYTQLHVQTRFAGQHYALRGGYDETKGCSP